MASHGRRGISKLLLGSQATEVVGQSSVRVLVYRTSHHRPQLRFWEPAFLGRGVVALAARPDIHCPGRLSQGVRPDAASSFPAAIPIFCWRGHPLCTGAISGAYGVMNAVGLYVKHGDETFNRRTRPSSATFPRGATFRPLQETDSDGLAFSMQTGSDAPPVLPSRTRCMLRLGS